MRLRGLVKFSARRATAAELEAEGFPCEDLPEQRGDAAAAAAAAATATPAGEPPSAERGGDGSQRGENGRGRRSGGGKGEGGGGGGEEASKVETAREEMLLEVQAKVCRSILSADITELQFLEACPGASYVKEFSVWNK